MGAGGWFWMSLTLLLFAALLVVAVVACVRALGRPRSEPAGTAERLLADRFARGEIDAEEYRQRLDVLRAGH